MKCIKPSVLLQIMYKSKMVSLSSGFIILQIKHELYV